ncbi:hypothetical protein ACQKMD_10700 [Viridibacillus sp. NPDC096237]
MLDTAHQTKKLGLDVVVPTKHNFSWVILPC